MRACLRHTGSTEGTNDQLSQILRTDDGYLSVDVVRHQVRVDGRDVRLTHTEFELLRHFMLHAGKVLTHRSLLRAV